MWLKEGREAINVAVPAGFFLKWMWRGSVSHKSQLEQLLVSKLRQRERSMTAWQQWHLPGRWLVVSSGQKELNEHPLNDSCPEVVSLGRREKMIHAWLSCGHALHCCAISLCWQCQFSNSLLSSLYLESLEGDDFLSSFFFLVLLFLPVFFLCLFLLCSLLFFYLFHIFFPLEVVHICLSTQTFQ